MNKTAVITGGSNGLGAFIKSELKDKGFKVFNLDHAPDTNEPVGSDFHVFCNVQVKSSVVDACAHVRNVCIVNNIPLPSILINNAGVNRIGWLQEFRDADWEMVMNTNAKGIFLVTKTFLSMLSRKELRKGEGATILNIVSNASHMPMTGSLAYNASKGAAHIMTLQLARELTRRNNITVFGISPNKLAGTEMSRYIEERVPEERGWTPEEARAYQLAAIPCGVETDPATLAEFITFLLSSKERHRYLSGCILPYGA
ncbi:MAG: SDR family oxidoreductase [Bacilli bacterium]